MKNFAELVLLLQSTRELTQLLQSYLERSSPSDQQWANRILSGKVFSPLFTVDELTHAIQLDSNLPSWLWERCLKETENHLEGLALIFETQNEPTSSSESHPSLSIWMENKLSAWAKNFPPPAVKTVLEECRGHSAAELLLLFQLFTGQWKSPIFLSTLQKAEEVLVPPPSLTSPHSAQLVLLYVEQSHLGTNLTLGVHGGSPKEIPQWLPLVTLKEWNLPNSQCEEIENWIRKNKREKFGPVQSVEAQLVFEVGFDCIESAPRKKTGITLKNAQLRQWKRSAFLQEVTSLSELKAVYANSLTERKAHESFFEAKPDAPLVSMDYRS